MRKFSAKIPFSNNKLQTGSTKLTNDNTEKNLINLACRWLERDGVHAANTVEAVWRGKDKPTLLVECFYDLSVLSPHRQRWVRRNWQLVRASRAGRRKKHGKFEYEFTASHKVNCQEWQDNVVLLSLALVFFHLLIRILAPDPPKVNNEQVNSDHLPSGSRPLTLGDPRVRHKPAKTHQQMKKQNNVRNYVNFASALPSLVLRPLPVCYNHFGTERKN